MIEQIQPGKQNKQFTSSIFMVRLFLRADGESDIRLQGPAAGDDAGRAARFFWGSSPYLKKIAMICDEYFISTLLFP